MCGVADALVQGGVIGFAGELPERYMQAVIAGTAASGPLLPLLCLCWFLCLFLVHLSYVVPSIAPLEPVLFWAHKPGTKLTHMEHSIS
jgi:hypothetical protein